MIRMLVLRPEPGAELTVERATHRGLAAFAVPLFEVEPAEWQAPDPADFDALLLTSANAVRHGGSQLERLRELKVYAVGEATGEAARNAGFEVGATGNSGVDGLLGSIDADLSLLHLCGEDRKELPAASQSVAQIVVYRSVPIDSPDLSSASGTIALIHSPRAGRRFAELIDLRKTISIAAISPAAAEAAGIGWKSVDHAECPTDEALLALAARLCNNSVPK